MEASLRGNGKTGNPEFLRKANIRSANRDFLCENGNVFPYFCK